MKHIGVSRRAAASVITALALGACSVPPVTFQGSDSGLGIDAIDATVVVALVVSVDDLTVPEAGMGSFTVALSAAPASQVQVSIDSADSNRVGVTPTSVLFDSTNWNTPRTITVSGREDADTENEAVDVSVGSSVGNDVVAVTVTDNDRLTIVATPAAGLDVSEGGTASLAVHLSAQPSGPISVTVMSSDTNTVSVSPPTLNFGTGTWDLDQNVVISGLQDADIVNGNANVTLSAPSLTDTVVPIQVIDDDVLGILPSTTNLGAVNEGGTVNFTVRLTQLPPSTVTVNVGTSDAALLTAGPTPLTFTTSTWMTPQLVTVNLPEDVDVADETASVTLMATGLTTRTVVASILDDDVQAIVAAPSPVPVDEGGVRTLNVHLQYQPSADITVSVTSLNLAVATVSTGSLTFTPGNYATDQPVVVSAPEDADVAAGMTTIRIESLADSLTRDVPVAVTDNDQLLIETSVPSVMLGEAGSVMFGVRLSAMPGATVTVNTSPSDSTAATISSGGSLMFTTLDYGTYKMVTVTGVADLDLATENLMLMLNASGLPTKSIDATVTDDDTQIVVMSSPGLTVGEGLTGQVGISLGYIPAGNVTVMVSSADTNAATVNPMMLTFMPGTYSTPQLVTVTGVPDADAIDDVTTLNATAPSATAGATTITVADDEQLGIETSLSSTSVGEAGTSQFNVRLTAMPAGTTTVMVTSSDTMAATALPAMLTFTTTDYNTFQPVTLTGVGDLDAVNDNITVNLTSPPLTMRTVNVTVNDDDTQDIILTTGAITLGEAGSNTFGVRLAAQPVADVIVTVAPSNGEATAGPTPLTFTSGNYMTNQTVTVNGVPDLDLTHDTVTINMTSPGLTTRSVTATVNDDDTQVVETTAVGTVTVNEGAFVGVGFKLRYIPSGPVAVTVTPAAGVSAAPTTLNFNAGNYSVAQDSNITGLQDDDAVDDNTMVTASAPSAASAVVPILVREDDVLGLETSVISLPVTEGSTATFGVRLTAAPTVDTMVGVASSDELIASINGPAFFTFNSSTWNTYQTVTVLGVQDVDVATEAATFTVTSGILPPKNVAITVNDDDTLAITTVPAVSLTLSEGSTGTIMVQLSHQPSGPVLVNAASTNGAVVMVNNGPNFTFDNANWNAAQSVSVTAPSDPDGTDGSARVDFSSASTATKQLPVTVIDDDITLTDLSVQMGPLLGGTTTTLIGTGFNAATTATMNGNAMTGLSLLSPTQISAVTPLHQINAPSFSDARVIKGPNVSSIPRAFYYGQWEHSSSGMSGGTINAIAIGGSTFVYAGTDDGIYRSNDGGNNFTRTVSGLPAQTPVRGISVSSSNPNTVYITSNAGIYTTTDGGDTWTPAGALTSPTFCVAINPNAPSTIVACTATEIVRSTDSGANWTVVHSGLNSPRYISFHDNGSGWLATGNGVFRSSNLGATWVPAQGNLPGSVTDISTVAAVPQSGSTAYLFSYPDVWKTTDNGATWNSNSLSGYSASSIVSNPNGGTLFAATSGGVFRSTNNGQSWLPSSGGIPARAQITKVLALRFTSEVYVGTQGNGVYKTTNTGVTWTKSDNGITAYQGSTIAPHPTIPGTVFAGTYGGAFKSTDYGVTWISAMNGISASGGEVYSIAYTPNQPSTMYMGLNGGGLWKSTDSGVNWSPTGLSSGSVLGLAVDPADPDIIFASRWPDGVVKSTDGGATFTPSNSGIPEANIWAIAFSGTAILAAEINNGVYRSTDGGASWTSSNTGLPPSGVQGLSVDSSGAVYAQLYNATYRSTNGGTSWTQIGSGTSAVAIDPSRPATGYMMNPAAARLERTLSSFVSVAPFNDGLPTGFTYCGLGVDKDGGAAYILVPNRGLYRVKE